MLLTVEKMPRKQSRVSSEIARTVTQVGAEKRFNVAGYLDNASFPRDNLLIIQSRGNDD